MSTILTSLPPVAKNMLYMCKKCDAERYHRVLAHTTLTKAKIECEICGSKKTFNLDTQKKKAATKTTAATRKRVSKSVAPTMWEELNKKYGKSTAIPYNFKTKFEVNSSIDHTKFGLGFVTKVEGKKMEVVFQDSVRQMVHSR